MTYSFEPHPSNVEILYWNIFLNNLKKYIIVIPIALYDKNLLLNFDLRDLFYIKKKKTKNLSFFTLSYLDSLIRSLLQKLK